MTNHDDPVEDPFCICGYRRSIHTDEVKCPYVVPNSIETGRFLYSKTFNDNFFDPQWAKPLASKQTKKVRR